MGCELLFMGHLPGCLIWPIWEPTHWSSRSRKTHIGSGNTPYINKGKRGMAAGGIKQQLHLQVRAGGTPKHLHLFIGAGGT
eukprot:scaffold1645_cov16-Tisochrysis_lutea.AAC.2